MSDARHRELAVRWWAMPIAEQLGNIGSEISRSAKWTSRNPDLARSAFYRALDLFDLTLDDPRHRRSPARLREIARAREVVVDLFAGPNQYGSTAASLQRYFDAYAACRSGKAVPARANNGS
jgi:hypothetical protein